MGRPPSGSLPPRIQFDDPFRIIRSIIFGILILGAAEIHSTLLSGFAASLVDDPDVVVVVVFKLEPKAEIPFSATVY